MMMRFLIAFAVFFLLNGIFRGQGITNSSNYSTGNQAGRDIVHNGPVIYQGYDDIQLDIGVVSLALEISKIYSTNIDTKLKEYSDSLYFFAQNALKNPKSKKAMDSLNDCITSFHTQPIRHSLSDKGLNVLNFIKRTSIDSANVESGGTCMGYTSYPFRFKRGENFKKHIFPFKNGFARVGIIPRDTSQSPKFGMINRYDIEIIPSIYDSVYDMSEGMILTRLGRKFTFFDTSGTKLDILKHIGISNVYPFSCGYAGCTIGGAICYIDRSGNFLLDSKKNLVKGFNHSPSYFIKHNRFVGVDGYYILKEKGGKFIARKIDWHDEEYDYYSERDFASDLSGFNASGFACARNKIIDTNFNVIRAIPGAEISMIENGFEVTYSPWYVSTDTGYTYYRVGVFNSKGEEVTSRKKYFDVLGTNYEFWIVTNWDGEKSVINKRGHELFPFRIQTIQFVSENLLKAIWYEGPNLMTKYYALDDDGNSIDVDECE